MPKDDLTLTIRVHDPLEKNDHTKSAVWVVAKVAREHVRGELTEEQFNEMYFKPALRQLTNLKFKENG